MRLTRLAFIGSLLLGIMLPSAVAAAPAPHIIFIGHHRDHNMSWVVFRNGLIAGMNRLNLNIEIRNPPSGDLEDMAKLVKNAIQAKPDGLILTVPREVMARQWVSEAQAADIPVVLVNSAGFAHFDNQGSFPLISIGLDQYQAGFSAGHRLKMQDMTNAICLVPRTDIDEYVTRCQGAADGLGKEIPVYRLDKIDSQLESFLQKYREQNPSWQTIILTETNHLRDIYVALRTVKLDKDIGIVTFGLTRNGAYLIRRKYQILFAVDSQPFLQGYQAASIYSNYYHHGVLWGSRHISTGPSIVQAGNVSKIIQFAGTIR